MKKSDQSVRKEFQTLVRKAYIVSKDVGVEVERALEEGIKHPPSPENAIRILTKALMSLKRKAEARGDKRAVKALEGDVNEMAREIIRSQGRLGGNGRPKAILVGGRKKEVHLEARNGIKPGPVLPAPWFHMREVPMNCGFMKTSSIQLWEGNDRLDIHLNQFQQAQGRRPAPEELLAIMLGEMRLSGVSKADQFKIVELANSIAVNGVRRPPILDLDGTLLDGNRRVAACFYILNSNEFTSEQKRRVEYLFVWQLTQHATSPDKEAVVVSLNFEDDCKQEWPEYVKARKVYQEWQAMVTAEPRKPSAERERIMKKELSIKFALGRDLSTVNRYLRMVEWANDFEEHHINATGKDPYEVKHRANEEFQYFDELSKGTKPGSVAWELTQNDSFRSLVFDLLYQDKFKNWTIIRDLRYYGPDVLKVLKWARDQEVEDKTERKQVQDKIEESLSEARSRQRESRTLNANEKINQFVKWLKDLPISAFSGPDIEPESLRALMDALKLVERQVRPAITKGKNVA